MGDAEETAENDVALQSRKLQLEIRKLEHDTSALHEQKLELDIKKTASDIDALGRFANKVWPIIATLLTFSLSSIAVWISISTQQKQFAAEQKQKHLESLNDALKLATDSSAEVDRRIAGIWQLRRSWEVTDDFEVAASTLTAELGLVGDKNRFARCAAAEVIGTAMSSVTQKERPILARILFGYKTARLA
jgi:hypothetical protein